MKLDLDTMPDAALLSVLGMVGAVAVMHPGETFESSGVTDVADGAVTFAIGTDSLTLARESILEVRPL